MPVVTIYGVPYGTHGLDVLIPKIQKSIASVPELAISSDQISVFFPKDHVTEGLGEELIATVLIWKKLERTPEVLAKMSEKLALVLKAITVAIPQCKVIEVEPILVDPHENGACRIEL